jgi:hypothetical protein
MEGIWREAFLKALTPIILITFAAMGALLPLYIVGNSMTINLEDQAIK